MSDRPPVRCDRCRSTSAWATAATAVPACSISSSPGTPCACARRSAPVIVSAEMAPLAALWRHRSPSSSRLSVPSDGSSAGRGVAVNRGAVIVSRDYPRRVSNAAGHLPTDQMTDAISAAARARAVAVSTGRDVDRPVDLLGDRRGDHLGRRLRRTPCSRPAP